MNKESVSIEITWQFWTPNKCWQPQLFLNCTEKASVFTEKASVFTEKASVFTEKASVSTKKAPVFTKTHFYKEYACIRESHTIPRKMFVFLRKSNTFLQRNFIHSEKIGVFPENGWPIRAIVKKRRPRVNSFLNKTGRIQRVATVAKATVRFSELNN